MSGGTPATARGTRALPFRTASSRLGKSLAAIAVAVVALGLLGGCRAREHVLTGEAMGTTYRIKVVGRAYPEGVQAAVATLLAELDRDLSTWREDSWITAFNRRASAEPVSVPERVWPLLVEAFALAEQTEGRFDPTIGGLVRLWGFGPYARRPFVPPSEEEIEQAIEGCGYWKVRLFTDHRAAAKLSPHLALDLSAVAKGFAADQIADELERRGYADFLIEFGGEVVVRGSPPGGRGWRVATPHAKTPVVLTHGALATSGSDHQHHDGLSHLIDPRSGRPIPTGDPVTVQAATGLRADALATAEAVRRATETDRHD